MKNNRFRLRRLDQLRLNQCGKNSSKNLPHYYTLNPQKHWKCPVMKSYFWQILQTIMSICWTIKMFRLKVIFFLVEFNEKLLKWLKKSFCRRTGMILIFLRFFYFSADDDENYESLQLKFGSAILLRLKQAHRSSEVSANSCSKINLKVPGEQHPLDGAPFKFLPILLK